jgi:hypothetical protein
MSRAIIFNILQYIAIAVLTFALSSYIIKRNANIAVRGIKGAMRSQTAVYNKTKDFIPASLKVREYTSQSKNHSDKYMVKVMVIDNNAYWVKDNIFFTADVQNGSVLPETTRQINTLDMSKQDIDKMMFILDKLKENKE